MKRALFCALLAAILLPINLAGAGGVRAYQKPALCVGVWVDDDLRELSAHVKLSGWDGDVELFLRCWNCNLTLERATLRLNDGGRLSLTVPGSTSIRYAGWIEVCACAANSDYSTCDCDAVLVELPAER